jgi:hypothetical protein
MTKKNSFDNFNEFNIYLVQNSMDLNFLEYIEYIHHSLFKHLKLNTIKYLFSLNDNIFDFSIDENILQTYSLINNNTLINDLIIKNNLIHDKDYRVRKKNNKDTKQLESEYKFTPFAFKKCLLYSNHLYIDIYLTLEQCMYNFNLYQNKLKHSLNAIINVKLDKIYDELKNNKFISITN